MRSLLADAGLADRVWLFAGKLHPVAVHFPIALLIVGVILEFARIRRGQMRPAPTARACVVVGALTAILAATMGWSDAVSAGHSEASVLLHRWFGVAAAALALLGAMFGWASTWRGTYRLFNAYRVCAVVAAGLVAVTGHLGGSLVYGPGYTEQAVALLVPRDGVPQATIVSGPPVAGAGNSRESAGSDDVDFVRDVRPIFARRCLSCHSGSEAASELNLDDHANVLRGGESGEPAIVEGDARKSRLIRLVSGQEQGLMMPPKGGPLDAEQIATLTRWVDQGAKWTAHQQSGEHWHWAYRPPKRPMLPGVQDTYWPRTPIDFFVLSRLEKESLSPSPEADRATLARRLSLDLIGLPPTPEEIEAFEQDRSADAYEEFVDRLLDSPHYGERWAQVWLDLARYADTHGYEKDQRRVMWPYRDWVIDAFNRDLPFDQFTLDQLAGDLLPDPSLDQLVATGFHRNTMVNEEGGVDQEEFRVDSVIDRVNTTASVWLGSTVGCCQCHDHKFDPLTQKDYYRFFAFFNQDEADSVHVSATESRAAGAMVPVPDREHAAEFRRLRDQLRSAETELRLRSEAESRSQEVWEQAALDDGHSWRSIPPAIARATEGASLSIEPDGAVVARGNSPDRSTYTVDFPSTAFVDPSGSGETTSIAGIKLTVSPDPGTPTRGVGRAGNGNFVLSELRADIIKSDGVAVPLLFSEAQADFEQGSTQPGSERWPAAAAIDGQDSGQGWAIGGQTDRAHELVLRFARPVIVTAQSVVRLRLVQNYGGQHTIGRFRFSIPTHEGAPLVFPVPETVASALRVDPSARTAEQRRTISDHFARLWPALRPLTDRVNDLQRQIETASAANAMVLRALPGGRETRVFQRGSFLSPGDRVEPEVPAVFSAIAGPAPGPDRLGLARWIVDPKNPLTARVQVNRVWSRLFGRGLVETEDDFGTQGEPPTHPELLDWLATEFVRQGWSQKALLRVIVTSATYRQSSNTLPQHLEKDPRNRLLARSPRFRIEAEFIRDNALAVSGLLSRKIGGPSVFPPQPPGVWTMIYSDDKWEESTGEDRYRRGLYTFWRRTAPYPMFTGFDAPSREIACTRRARTNTPLQALSTLNDPQFVEAAKALALRMLEVKDRDPLACVARGFRLCTGRSPSAAESDRLVRLFHEQASAYLEDPSSAMKLSGVESSAANEVAAWQVVANVLLNLDETLNRP